MDQIVHLLELAVKRRSRRLALAAAAGALLILAGGLWGPIARWLSGPAPIVAGAPFTEQHILAEAMTLRLQEAGFRVDKRLGMGETIQFLGLRHDQIDCCVNYTGNVWATLMKRKHAADSSTTYAETTAFLREQYGVECLGKLGFENAYALAMRRQVADALGIRSIDDLARHATGMAIAGDLQFFERHEWREVKDRYRLQFKKALPMDATLMYQAIEKDVDVICAYSSDGRIVEKDLVILEDPLQVFPPYDAILLLSRKGAGNAKLREALSPLVQAVNMTAMRRANMRVDVAGQSPRQAARELLEMTARPAKTPG